VLLGSTDLVQQRPAPRAFHDHFPPFDANVTEKSAAIACSTSA
jgi:hypothetical protein